MSLNLGNTKIKEIYLGNTKIKEAYLGSTKVYGQSNFTLLFSSNSPVSSGTLSETVANFDEIMVCHGLSCSNTKTFSFSKVGNQLNVDNVVFDETNNRFVRYVARYSVSGTSFSRTGNPHCNYHNLSSGTWSNDSNSYRNNHIYEIWGIKYA